MVHTKLLPRPFLERSLIMIKKNIDNNLKFPSQIIVIELVSLLAFGKVLEEGAVLQTPSSVIT